jgi:LAO/AO transport system kinase
VFIRSTASRGGLGGLALTTGGAINVLDAAGFDLILVETVGAGQNEVDIAAAAHTTLVVEAPGLGDGVQAIKAGILEIADILVVNKSDLPGASNTVRSLRASLEIGHPTKIVGHHGAGAAVLDERPQITGWVPPIVETVASDGTGIPALIDHIHAHRNYLIENQLLEAARTGRIRTELEVRLRAALYRELLEALPEGALNAAAAEVAGGAYGLGQAVQTLLNARNQNAPS